MRTVPNLLRRQGKSNDGPVGAVQLPATPHGVPGRLGPRYTENVMTSTTLTPAETLTPDDLLTQPDAIRFELVDGHLVERNMGMESSKVAGQILGLIWLFLRSSRLGHLFGPDAGYQCFVDDPRKVRKPDVSFVAAGRLPGDRAPTGYCLIAPDLAIEVISPSDVFYDVEEKIAEYLNAGVKRVWVVNPQRRTVSIHRPPGSGQGAVTALSEADKIGGEDVLPGFEASVKEFFV